MALESRDLTAMVVVHPLSSYPLALLSLIGEGLDAGQDPPLGYATRVGVQNSQFNVAAHRFLKAIIEHSPSPPAVAKEFLIELRKCQVAAVMDLGNVHSFSRIANPCF